MGFSCEFICASIFTVLCIVLAFVYRHVCKFYLFFEKLGISGPVPSFMIGTWKEAPQTFLGDADVENAKLYGKVYGTFDGLTPNLMVIEPKIVKQILLTYKDRFINRKVTRSRNVILKKSLSFLYGEDQEVQALTNSLVPESKLEKLLPRLDSTANSLVQNILKRSEEGAGFNVVPLIKEYIHDLIAFAIFGIDLNSDVSVKDEFIGYCEQIFTTKTPNSKLTLLLLLYENLQGDSWIFPQRALDYFVNLITTSVKQTPRDPVVTEGKAANFIELMIEASEEEKALVKNDKDNSSDGLVLTEEVIIAKCLSAILALINYTRLIILLTLHSLASETEVQDELSAEVKKNKTEKITMTDLQNLQILDMIIAEVVRLYPPEFRIEKECKEPVSIEKLNFEKGSRVSVPLFALHRHPDHYPEQEKFDLRRFSQESIENRDPFTYLPFGQAGVSSCNISVQLALMTSKITVFKLIEKFKFKPQDNNNKVTFKKGLTGVPKIPILNLTTELKV